MEDKRTLVLIKPNSVHRGLIGKILNRFEEKGFTIVALKLLWMTRDQAKELYKEHVGKHFYEPTINFMTSSPIVALIIRGYYAVSEVRRMMGPTDPREASPGSIRGDFGERVEMNCIHGSSSEESAEREIAIFFEESEILDYKRVIHKWI